MVLFQEYCCVYKSSLEERSCVCLLRPNFRLSLRLKISAWRKKDKNGSDYLSLSVSEKMQKRTEFDGGYQHMEEKKTPIDDDIPF